MKPSNRHLGVAILLFLLLGLTFWAGRWTGSLKANLQQESKYAWELHRKIAEADVSCNALTGKEAGVRTVGHFSVESLDAGSTLVVATLDTSKDIVHAFVIDQSGRLASDSWSLSCRK